MEVEELERGPPDLIGSKHSPELGRWIEHNSVGPSNILVMRREEIELVFQGVPEGDVSDIVGQRIQSRSLPQVIVDLVTFLIFYRPQDLFDPGYAPN